MNEEKKLLIEEEFSKFMSLAFPDVEKNSPQYLGSRIIFYSGVSLAAAFHQDKKHEFKRIGTEAILLMATTLDGFEMKKGTVNMENILNDVVNR